jgi:hypothetical protein
MPKAPRSPPEVRVRGALVPGFATSSVGLPCRSHRRTHAFPAGFVRERHVDAGADGRPRGHELCRRARSQQRRQRALKPKAVKTSDLGDNAVTLKNIHNGSLLTQPFALGQLSKGDIGATGATGAKGPTGATGSTGASAATGSFGDHGRRACPSAVVRRHQPRCAGRSAPSTQRATCQRSASLSFRMVLRLVSTARTREPRPWGRTRVLPALVVVVRSSSGSHARACAPPPPGRTSAAPT